MLTLAGPVVRRDIHDLGDWNGIITPMEWQLFHSGIVDDRHVTEVDAYQDYCDERFEDDL